MEAIKVDKLKPEFKFEVASYPGGANIKNCFACGACTGGCPVSEIDNNFDPRKIIRMVLLGFKEKVLSSDFIWYCVECYTCSFHCPQDVKFREIMGVLREVAEKEGYVHKSFIENMKEVGKLSQIVRHKMVEKILDKKSEDLKVDPKDLLNNLEL